MIVLTAIGLIALFLAISFLGIYILPIWAGFQVFRWMIDSDKIGIDSIFFGIVTGVVTYFLLRFTLNRIRSRNLLRIFVAIIVLPVIWMGYMNVLDVLHDKVPLLILRHAIALLIGVACGYVTLVRINLIYRPRRMQETEKPAEVFEAEIVDPEPMQEGSAGIAHAKLLDGPHVIDANFFKRR
jgi:hypothetical protein